ncbi:MAG: hypothetical protein K8U03_16985 [Planctomycetia bacterium]|nr:hypothetical protein [Planctomycetia bacterium]
MSDAAASDDGSDPLRAGRTGHKALSPEVSEQMEVVYGVIGPYLDMTLEELEIDLMSDAEPEDEAIVWIGITAAWDSYHQQYLDDEVLDDEEEKKIVAALIAISAGEKDIAALPVVAEVGKKLLACYEGLADD